MRYFLCLAMLTSVFSADLKGRIKKQNWDGLEVVYIQDERFPIFNLMVYFADGALSDEVKGETNAMFSMLESGTRRYTRSDINDSLDFYGIKRGPSVFHEFSLYYVSGLEKDLMPAMKKVCHLFQDSNFPQEEIKKEVHKAKSELVNMVSDPENLANRIFRELSLKNTPYSYPVGGKLKDLDLISQDRLKAKLKYFNEKVKKKIFLSGPKQIFSMEKIINEECGWRNQSKNYVRNSKFTTADGPKLPEIYLVTIPNANQAQIRIGRYLKSSEIQNEELLTISSGLLGGGFTSQLMVEVRQKRGLTYSINSIASRQKDYGRAAIYTSTKNESVETLLTVVKQTVDNLSQGQVSVEEVQRAKGYLVGGQFFRFENAKNFLNQLIFLDHYGKPFDDLFKFAERINGFNKDQITKSIANLFGWEKQTIMVLGTSEQEKKLSPFGEVKVIDYKNFL